MIRSVHFENFRCLKDVELLLQPLTVLVGASSSGKTSVLEGMQYRLACEPSDYWRMDTSLRMSLQWTFEDGKQVRRVFPLSAFDSMSLHGHSVQSLALDLGALRNDSSMGRVTMLSPNGENLASVFSSLTPSQREAVVSQLCLLVPSLQNVGLHQTGPRTHQLRFQDRWHPDLWFTPWQVAESVMYLMAFLVLPYQTPLPDVLTLDEPERGLHSRLLRQVIGMLRRLSTGAMGVRPVQVVIATHSFDLLEHIPPNDLRLLSRSLENGAVQVSYPKQHLPEWKSRSIDPL
ncbi:AAA family ATPase [Stigmatella sp. ncwal1]|uniref:AAA family ATPase n=1 Tax=Stigmatella ashevillensis TaxID=2995309 RepID=A0ABT5DIE1_9BACT|nr:AAA family ATPase [Stigmatella ashevillena]MDC0713426.1 AAA family ATPase [Stigmatella ashevillena]